MTKNMTRLWHCQRVLLPFLQWAQGWLKNEIVYLNFYSMHMKGSLCSALLLLPVLCALTAPCALHSYCFLCSALLPLPVLCALTAPCLCTLTAPCALLSYCSLYPALLPRPEFPAIFLWVTCFKWRPLRFVVVLQQILQNPGVNVIKLFFFVADDEA